MFTGGTGSLEPQSKSGYVKVSKGRSPPEIAADIRLLSSLYGSGSIPGFDCDSLGLLDVGAGCW